MADIRINALATTATTPASDDYLALDGTAQGTRKILATNIANNVTDVILGASGPSVKSTLSARAPRQGLVFDGTTGGSFTLTSAPSGSWSTDQTALIPTANPSSAIGLFAIGGTYSTDATIAMYISAGGALVVEQNTAAPSSFRTASISGFRSAYSGKTVRIATTVSSSTLTIYVNGVSASYSETTTGGSPPAWGATLGSATSYFGKLTASQYYFNSALGPLYIYNRALSASEVVALYEAGAPAGADYNSASNTNISADTFVNGTGAATFSGASATAFTISGTTGGAAGTAGRAVYGTDLGASLRIGTKYRVTFSATITSGEAPIVAIGHSGTGYASNQVTVTNGTNTLELTIDTTRASNRLLFVSSPSTAINYSVSSLVWTRLGLLLAPDAAQAGGGLTWYDTSGNAANITLPASGVSWNVPTSGYVTSGSSLNLSAGGTNQNITLTPSGTGKILLKLGDVDSQVNIEKRSTADIAFIGGNAAGSAARTLYFQGASVQFGIGGVGEVGRFAPTTGNFLIGGTIDGGQKLQVAGTALIAPSVASANIFFVRNTASNGYSTIQFENTVGNAKGYIGYGNTGTAVFPDQFYIAGASSIVLAPGGYTTGLTLDSSQRAQFEGKVTINGANSVLVVKGANPTSSASSTIVDWASNARIISYGSTVGTAAGFNFVGLSSDGSVGGTRFTIDSAGDATFAGKTYTAAGAAATPAISFSGDTDSGFYNAGGNQVALACGGIQIWNTTVNGLSMASGKDIYLGNAYVAGAPTATGYVTIKDSAGNIYKVLVGT